MHSTVCDRRGAVRSTTPSTGYMPWPVLGAGEEGKDGEDEWGGGGLASCPRPAVGVGERPGEAERVALAVEAKRS